MIYTIGYSTRTLPEFLRELEKYGITKIIDVRSRPWSRNASFSANQIERWSSSAGILYLQLGCILGGSADIALEDARYQSALKTVVNSAKAENIALFCAEGDPALCHRVWDVGASLLFHHGVSSINILRSGNLERIETTIRRVRRSNFSPSILKVLDNSLPLYFP